jgi:hypothetical protein
MTSETTKVIYRDEIGSGAVEYARQITQGLTRDQTASIMPALLRGELNDPTDKRVKRCDYCGYWWRDDSSRNRKQTCSDDCKRGIKTMQRREQRANKELLNPKPKIKKHRLIDDYIWWLEYPFWVQEYSMIKLGWKYEKNMSVAKMDYIRAKQELYGPGNRKKPKRVVDYHGDDRDKL